MLRPALYFAIDLVIASLGVAILESSLYRLFPQPTDIPGIYEKEFLMSAGIALILGFFVYWSSIRRTALWVWALGLCLLVIRVVMGAEQSEAVFLLSLLAIRLLFYSFGALTCSWTLRSDKNQAAVSRPGLASLLWILGAPPKLPAGIVEAMRSEEELRTDETAGTPSLRDQHDEETNRG